MLLGVATDISARKKVEHSLEAARDIAERGSRAKNEFLCRLSVEFRSALCEMIGTASDVRADRERRLTARELEQLGDLLAVATQLLGTVADLHDFLRIESGEIAVQQIDRKSVV